MRLLGRRPVRLLGRRLAMWLGTSDCSRACSAGPCRRRFRKSCHRREMNGVLWSGSACNQGLRQTDRKAETYFPGHLLQKNWSCPGKAVHVPVGHSSPRAGMASARATRAPMRGESSMGEEGPENPRDKVDDGLRQMATRTIPHFEVGQDHIFDFRDFALIFTPDISPLRSGAVPRSLILGARARERQG